MTTTITATKPKTKRHRITLCHVCTEDPTEGGFLRFIDGETLDLDELAQAIIMKAQDELDDVVTNDLLPNGLELLRGGVTIEKLINNTVYAPFVNSWRSDVVHTFAEAINEIEGLTGQDVKQWEYEAEDRIRFRRFSVSSGYYIAAEACDTVHSNPRLGPI